MQIELCTEKNASRKRFLYPVEKRPFEVLKRDLGFSDKSNATLRSVEGEQYFS